MSKPRVLLLLHQLSRTGAPKIALDAFEAMREQFDCRILAPYGGPLTDRCLALGPTDLLATIPDPLKAQLSRRLTGRGRWDPLERSLRDWRPDVIFVNTIVALQMFEELCLPNVPVVLHVHELESFIREFASNRWFREVPSAYIAVSDAVARCLIDDFGITSDKVACIHEFVRLDEYREFTYKPAVARKERAPYIIGGAGSANLRKGVTLWAEMAAELVALVGSENVRFKWVGLSDEPSDILFRRLIDKMGLGPFTELVPIIDTPLKEFQNFDVFAMTSLEDPCPLVVLEAMMLGKPVACFADSGGAVEEVGETGIVVQGFRPGEMARAIARLLEEPARLAQMGTAAKARVEERFSDTVQVPKIRDVITSVIGRR